jgi:CubicO group peptidase (beta-lactamase class C family)
VDHVAAAVVARTGDAASTIEAIGDTEREYRLASLSKCMTAWATLIADEEGIVGLDTPLDQPGVPDDATLRHLLSHTSGLPFDGDRPVAGVGARRIYSNTGIELAADVVATAADMPFSRYLAEAVFEPLAMSHSELRGSPAHGVWSTVDDIVAFVAELLAPTLLAAETAADATAIQYPELAGIVPGVGSFNPCPWGLGMEIRGDKSPHWTGRANSPATFGHFGGAGTMMWVDPAARVGLVALTDRPYEEWAAEALQRWSELSDAVLAEPASTRSAT